MIKKTGKILVILLLISICMVSLFGCSKKVQNNNDKPIIAVTIIPQQTFVEAVCGDLVDVVTLIPPGNSAESYEPSPMEIENFQECYIYFSIGLPTEETYILPNAKDIKIVSLQDKVNSVYEDKTFSSGDRDPHIWLSPKRVKVMIQVIADEMSIIDEKNKETYQKNAIAYIEKLDELDKEIKLVLESVSNKKFIVFHPAFGYIAEDYSLEMYSLEEEGKEATAKHLQEMIDLAKKEQIKVIFYQEEMDSSQSKAYAEEIGGVTIQLSPLSADYIENLKNMVNTMAEAME